MWNSRWVRVREEISGGRVEGVKRAFDNSNYKLYIFYIALFENALSPLHFTRSFFDTLTTLKQTTKSQQQFVKRPLKYLSQPAWECNNNELLLEVKVNSSQKMKWKSFSFSLTLCFSCVLHFPPSHSTRDTPPLCYVFFHISAAQNTKKKVC